MQDLSLNWICTFLKAVDFDLDFLFIKLFKDVPGGMSDFLP